MNPRRALSLAALALLIAVCTGCAREQTVDVATLAHPDAPSASVVSGALDAQFTARGGDTIVIAGPADASGWWRVTARRGFDVAVAPQLVFSDAHLVHIELWTPGGALPETHATYGKDAVTRYAPRRLTIPLPDGIGAGSSIYLKVKAHNAPIRVGIETLADARLNDRLHTQVHVMLLSAIGIAGLLVLGFGLGLGERLYLYFAVWLLGTLAGFEFFGLGFGLLPLPELESTLRVGGVIGTLSLIAGIVFLDRYLELAARQPLLHRGLLICGVLIALQGLAFQFMPRISSWSVVLENAVIVTMLALLLIATVRGCLLRQRAAWFVLISFLPLILSAITLAIVRIAEARGWIVGPMWLNQLLLAGNAFAAVLLAFDLTERMLATRRERRDALRESARRGQQLATASHDIRQPLLALRATLARLTETGELAPVVFDRFRNSLDYMDKLAAGYTSGRDDGLPAPATPEHAGAQAPAETVPVDLLLRNVELMFREEAEAKGLEFRVRGTDAAVTVDAMAAMRIVSNLVANAVRYTQRGKVLVGCRRRGDRIAIVVADTGPGMTDDELARVLRESERGSSAAGTEGSGLGLGIVQRLAAECGFVLRAVSIPGRGSSFSVELPLGVTP